MVRGILAAGIAAMSCAWMGASASTIVYSNNLNPGDTVVGPTGLVPIGASGWNYYDVRVGSTTGINTTFARSGNGSLYLELTKGASKAVGIYGNSDLSPLGALADLDALSYEWYRSSASTVNDFLAPVLGLVVSNGTTQGWVVYEPVYNGSGPGNPPATTDTWMPTNAISGKFWSTIGAWQLQTLAGWQSTLAGYNVIGVAAYGGSGWKNGTVDGLFVGAVDNVAFGFNGSANTYNFEVQAVPEPSSIALMAIAGGVGLAGAARRRSRLARG